MMSNHRKPLSELERLGLEAHGLGRHIGKPSQLADAFRHGIAWALANAAPPAQTPANSEVRFGTQEQRQRTLEQSVRPAQTPPTYAPNTDEPRHTLPDQAPIPVLITPAQTPPPRLTYEQREKIFAQASSAFYADPNLSYRNALATATEDAVRAQLGIKDQEGGAA